jgi:hypothetical protein
MPADKPTLDEMTEAQVRALLGPHVAPQGLYDARRDMPFTGHVTCNRDRLVAGEWAEVVIVYEVGPSGVADGAWFKATFKFYSDWALFQTADPRGANYISAEYQAGALGAGQSPATVQSLKVRFDQKGHERPYQKAVIVDTVDGYLQPGDKIVIRLGDRRQGGPGTRVQTFVEDNFRFRCYVDPLGTSRFCAVAPDIAIDIVAGPPARLQLRGNRLVRAGEAYALRLSAADAWDNPCKDLAGAKVEVTAVSEGREGYRKMHDLPTQGWATIGLEDLPRTSGHWVVRAQLAGHPETAPAEFHVTVEADLAVPRVYFADLHVHSHDTVGTNSPFYNTSYGRDIAGLDVMTYTANDFQITNKNWQIGVDVMNEFHREGAFLCFPVQEWCGSSCVGGDHNVVFLHGRQPDFPLNPQGWNSRSFEWNEDMGHDRIVPGAWPIEKLWACYIHDPEHHLIMPHVGGRRYIPDWHHPQLERLIEISSSWGHFHWLYADVIRRGYKLGASASGDEHRGRPGGGAPGVQVFGVRGGITGVLAPALEREPMARALRARHTYASTSERTVGLTRCGQHMQGDEFKQRGGAKIDYRFLGQAGWEEVSAYDHNGLLWTRNLHEELGYSERRVRVRWGGARIPDRYRWAEWRGTLSITNGTINGFTGRGFEHQEESCWRAGPTTIGFRSDTYGDADQVEVDISNLAHATLRVEGTIDGYVKVGNPLDGNPFVHCPRFELEVKGAELLEKGGVRVELGGCELFIAIERMTDAPLPLEISGSLAVDPVNADFGFRPVYFIARQIDDEKTVTSAMFIEFTP